MNLRIADTFTASRMQFMDDERAALSGLNSTAIVIFLIALATAAN
jgi:hypothetical protein